MWSISIGNPTSTINIQIGASISIEEYKISKKGTWSTVRRRIFFIETN